MDVKSFLHITVFASVIMSSSAVCEIRDADYFHCKYTVVCTWYPGKVSNPSCDYGPYVIFVIQNSSVEQLTTGFFAPTNFDYRVHEIAAIGNSWNTIDSYAFKYYIKCDDLDISNNNIVKIKNEAFKNLELLMYLNISNNNIERLDPKSLLISDSKDNFVQELDFSNNKLIELSDELNELSHMKKLHLQNNMLEKLADDAFLRIKNLNYLNLRNNRLRSLNLSLNSLKLLQTLDVSHNYLIILSGYEINHLVAIVDFNASHNALTSVESNYFNQSFSLQTVDFSYNSISTIIENVMFTNNNKLKYLNFNNNLIKGIQENSFKQCRLDYIYFENNNITGDIKVNNFTTGLRDVTKLDLSRQYINSIRDKAFVHMESLLHLNLSSNNIDVVENSSFVNTSITVLDLSYNKVSYLYFLQNCLTNLTELYITNNNITVVPKHVFDSQTQMKILDLSMNSIISIEEFSLPLKKLQYLNIVGNRLNGIIRKNVFSPAKYLRFLDLSNCNISQIDDSAFVDLTVLARLNLSNNQIETINPNNFKGADNMYSLDISHNNLTNLSFNSSILNNLKSLYLNNNIFTQISKLFLNTSKLLYLDMSNNNINDLTEVGADILPNLTVLHLANNDVINFNNPKINSLITLVDLVLSSNQIRNVNLSYFKELMSVDLSNNNLTYINSTLLKSNEYLQSLDVSENNISDLPPGTFQYMKNLKLLNLSSNYLTKLRFGSLKGLHKTELLDLSRNNIASLDVDVFYDCNELKTLIIDYNRIKSFDIQRLILMSLRKLKTLSLGGNPVSCKEIAHNIKFENLTFYAIRQVEVTSIDKIYHEANFHGIQCGGAMINISTTVTPTSTDLNFVDNGSSFSSTGIVLIWCSLLTILLIAAGFVAYIKLYKKRLLVVNSNMTLQIRNSLELDGSDFQSDLLGL